MRPMADADIPQVATVTAEAFATDIGTAVLRSIWEQRLRHSLLTDPGGSFVTERSGLVTGAAQAVIREGIWILSLMAVSPTLGKGGEGRALMQATLGYDGDCRRCADHRLRRPAGTAPVRIVRIRARADLQGHWHDRPDADTRAAPRDHDCRRRASSARSAPISRAARGAAHTPDLEVARFRGSSFLRLEDRGFVVTTPDRGIWMLAACDEQAAAALLWHGLAELHDEPQVDIGWISGRQQWALDVCVAARLSFTTYGAIGTRGAVGPLHPYIPSPPFA